MLSDEEDFDATEARLAAMKTDILGRFGAVASEIGSRIKDVALPIVEAAGAEALPLIEQVLVSEATALVQSELAKLQR